MSDVYENFDGYKGFSLFSECKYEELINYHPPKFPRPDYEAETKIETSPTDGEHVKLIADENVWGDAGRLINQLVLKQKNSTNTTPVDEIFHTGAHIGVGMNGFIMMEYKIQRKKFPNYDGVYFVDSIEWAKADPKSLRLLIESQNISKKDLGRNLIMPLKGFKLAFKDNERILLSNSSDKKDRVNQESLLKIDGRYHTSYIWVGNNS